jgi:hypothetical protein
MLSEQRQFNEQKIRISLTVVAMIALLIFYLHEGYFTRVFVGLRTGGENLPIYIIQNILAGFSKLHIFAGVFYVFASNLLWVGALRIKKCMVNSTEPRHKGLRHLHMKDVLLIIIGIFFIALPTLSRCLDHYIAIGTTSTRTISADFYRN